jgi:hypothetical protein
MLDPLAFAAAAAAAGGSLPFPYFLPSLLSQSASTTGTNNNSTSPYPFSSLSSSLLNPAASLYPFLSPDWFTSPSKFMEGFGNLTSDKSTGNKFFLLILKKFIFLLDSKESTSHQTVNKNFIFLFHLIYFFSLNQNNHKNI